MRATSRRLAAALAALLALGALAPAALAAAPDNDTFPNATAVSIGFSDVVDTTEATTDADDAQLNADCGAPATDASVWYAIEGSDENVFVDFSGSDYSGGILVGAGTQGALSLVACGQFGAAFFASAGTTYYILAVDDQLDGDGRNGGSLHIAFTAIERPTVNLTVDRTGTVDKAGVAHLSGTFTCENADFVEVDVDARQSVGRFLVRGFGASFQDGLCDGASHPWTVDVIPENGTFAGGKVATFSFGIACNFFDCAFTEFEQSISLRGSKR